MNLEILARIDALLAEALDLPSAQRRAHVLSATDDEEVRREVLRLLEYADEESRTSATLAAVHDALSFESVFDTASGAASDTASGAASDTASGAASDTASGAVSDDRSEASRLGPGARVGAYRLVRELGEGGMGVVYLAERADGSFEQQTALKLLPGRGLSKDALRRFERERQILARLDHENIARLLDGGVDDLGRPFLVMELVDGLPITTHCDLAKSTLEERLRLIIDAARAVHAAHRNLVVHCDLKPSNLMVKGDGVVKLLDFGIAKLVGPDDVDGDLTRLNMRPMTPSYASPESVIGTPLTTAADVYQLGLLAFELVCGRRAHDIATGSMVDLVAKVVEQAPKTASRALLEDGTASVEGSAEEIALRRGTTVGKLRRRISPELDAILHKALATEPERRYPSAEEFATDLQRYLDGKPVRARPDSFFYRARKWIGRHPGTFVSTALLALLTIGYSVVLTAQARALAEERDRAASEARRASEVEHFLVDLFEVVDPGRSRGETVTARELLRRGVERIDEDLASEPAARGRLLSTLGETHRTLGLYDEAQELLERSLAEHLERVGPRPADPDEIAHRATILHRLGVCQRKRGESEASRRSLDEAIRWRRTLLGDSADTTDRADLAESLLESGYTEYLSGGQEAAQERFEEANAILLEVAGSSEVPGSSEITGARESLARTYDALGLAAEEDGRLADAESMHRKALELHVELFGELHPAVATDLYNLARALQEQDQYLAAQPHIERAAAIERVILGPDHPELGVTLTLAANNLQVLGRLDEAERFLAEALAIYEAKLDPVHPRTAMARNVQGQIYYDQGRFAESETALRRSFAELEELYGTDHINVARTLIPLARTLAAQGKTDEAVQLLERGLGIADGVNEVVYDRVQRELDAVREGTRDSAGDD